MVGSKVLVKKPPTVGWSLGFVLALTLIAVTGSHQDAPPSNMMTPRYPSPFLRGSNERTNTATLVYLPLVERSGPTIYHVSKAGNNQDGKSWLTAWNELNQIDWDVVKSGDTILLDGGPTEMVYTTTLTIGKSGTPSRPITIALASEAGRNGRVVIFGGRAVPLPYCGERNYTQDSVGIRRVGVFLDRVSWVVIDGRKWSGIVIYGHSRDGIELHTPSPDDRTYPLCEQIVFRGLEIYDNGNAWQSGGSWQPGGFGVGLSGRHITFERTLIHDNGTDAIATSGMFEDLTLRRVWLYNQRPHPTRADEPWNYCIHTDGVQVYVGGNVYGLKVEDSIIGPGLMHGLLLGDHGSPTVTATVHNVTISNTLLVLHHGGSSNANVATKYDSSGPYPNDQPTGYRIDNCTFVRDVGQEWFNILIHGTGHTVTDSMFRGGVIIRVDGNPVVSNNYWWQVAQPGGIGTEADPMFVDDEYAGVGDGFADFDFRTQNPVIAGVGSSIASPDDLLGD